MSLSGQPPTTATVGSPYSFPATASSSLERRIYFWVRNKPAWASFDYRRGILSGVPRTVGTYNNIVIAATDGRSYATLPPFSITVTKSQTTNSAPVISGTPATTGTTGGLYSFTPTASDTDRDPLSFSVKNKPAWASFSISNGKLSGTPSAAGTHSDIVISVSDGKASNALPPFSIKVAASAPGTGDTTLPSVPTGVTAAPTSSSRIDLTWSASTDNVGVTGYRLFRCSGSGCTPSTQVAMPSSTSYADSGLSAATAYRYRVAAVDGAGNVSGFSAAVGATTPAASGPADTTAPSVPAGLSATASGTSRVDLSWTAATDNVKVTGYRVYRCSGASCTPGTQVGNATATAYADSSLTAGTAYRYRVTAIDAAGNVSGFSSIATATTATAPTSGGSDFAARCAAAGVVKCVGFDSSSDISGGYQDNSGILPGETTPTLDTGTKSSGAGSLKFTIPGNSGSDTSGTYFTNFSNDLSVQFGASSEFYVQWRQRFSPEMLTTLYRGEGFKHAILTTGDKPGGTFYNSCEAIGIVMQNYAPDARFPILYNSCTGSSSHGAYDGFYEPWNGPNGFDFKLQNARPTPYCLYSQGNGTPSYLPPQGNCFGYFPDEWMTFQLGVRTGPRVNDEFVDSYITLWIARENQPAEMAIQWGPYKLSAGSSAEDQKYGKVWLLPYNTNKDAGQAHPTAYTWYDELIISRNRIADPTATSTGGGTSDMTRPSTPTGVSATATSTTQVGVKWTAATDNVGVSGYRVRRNGTHVGSTNGSTSYTDSGLNANTTYSYTLTAVDAAGNLSLESASATATTPAQPTSPPPTSAGSLGQAAAALAPGQWAQLSTSAFNGGVFLETQTTGKSVLQWSDKAIWDPVRRQFRFLGSPHYEPYKHIVFSDSTNSWTSGALPFGADTLIHGYQHNAVNPSTGESYFRQYGTGNVFRFNPAANSWSALPDVPSPNFSCCGALEYFPERNELVFVDGAWGVWAYSFAANQWSKRASGMGESGGLPLGEISNIALYSSKAKAILFGGGDSRTLFKYDASGNVTRLPDAPIQVGIYDTVATVDPVSGKYLFLGADRSFRELDLTTNTWRTLSSSSLPLFQSPNMDPVVFDIVAAPVSTYGVVMFVKYYFNQSKVYLYKHAP